MTNVRRNPCQRQVRGGKEMRKMNKIYKTIWSQVRQCYVVVSEIAKREGKSKTGQGRRGLSLLVLSFVLAGGISLFPAQGIEAGFIGDFEEDEAYWNNGGAIYGADLGTFGVRVGGGGGPNQKKIKFRYGLVTGETSSRGSLEIDAVKGYLKYRTALGEKFYVWGEGATALGYNSRADGIASMALGWNSTVKSHNGIAMGTNSESGGNGAMAVGIDSKANGQDAIALGNQSVAINDQSVTLGAKSMAVQQATAIGTDVYAMGQGSVAIGGDDTTEGSEFTDKLPEATIERLYSKLWDPASPYHPFKGDDYGKAEFRGKYINGNNRIYSPTYTGGVGSIAIGVRSIAAKDGSTAMGVLSMALGKHSTAMGTRSMVAENAEGGLAVGEETRVLSSHGVAIGNQTYSDQNGSVAYGYNSKAVGEGAMALGRYVGANAELTDESRKNLKSMLTVRVDKNVEDQYKRYDTTEKRLEYLSKNKAEYKENKDRILRTYQKRWKRCDGVCHPAVKRGR